MNLQVKNLGKRFQREWIFKGLSADIPQGSFVVVTGANGSGKSTLLKQITGAMPQTEGEIIFALNEKRLPIDLWYKQLTYAAPYLELIEEFTLTELLDFHFQFRKPLSGIAIADMPKLMLLENQTHKYISDYSSGMKQRVKLGLAFFTDCALILLDEPGSNLDVNGLAWYRSLIGTYKGERTLIVCSNDETEYKIKEAEISLLINIMDYKTA
jgi:ABC-type multidrug transport system ATPase subunit